MKMSENDDSPSKHRRGRPKSAKLNGKSRNQRTNSMDSLRSVSTVASSSESVLLRSDDEDAVPSTESETVKAGKSKDIAAKPKQQTKT